GFITPAEKTVNLICTEEHVSEHSILLDRRFSDLWALDLAKAKQSLHVCGHHFPLSHMAGIFYLSGTLIRSLHRTSLCGGGSY
ncbi:hypothetical protein LEMLEM_LOCUS11065, partial [Lemmus lemmus]